MRLNRVFQGCLHSAARRAASTKSLYSVSTSVVPRTSSRFLRAYRPAAGACLDLLACILHFLRKHISSVPCAFSLSATACVCSVESQVVAPVLQEDAHNGYALCQQLTCLDPYTSTAPQHLTNKHIPAHSVPAPAVSWGSLAGTPLPERGRGRGQGQSPERTSSPTCSTPVGMAIGLALT